MQPIRWVLVIVLGLMLFLTGFVFGSDKAPCTEKDKVTYAEKKVEMQKEEQTYFEIIVPLGNTFLKDTIEAESIRCKTCSNIEVINSERDVIAVYRNASWRIFKKYRSK